MCLHDKLQETQNNWPQDEKQPASDFLDAFSGWSTFHITPTGEHAETIWDLSGSLNTGFGLLTKAR